MKAYNTNNIFLEQSQVADADAIKQDRLPTTGSRVLDS